MCHPVFNGPDKVPWLRVCKSPVLTSIFLPSRTTDPEGILSTTDTTPEPPHLRQPLKWYSNFTSVITQYLPHIHTEHGHVRSGPFSEARSTSPRYSSLVGNRYSRTKKGKGSNNHYPNWPGFYYSLFPSSRLGVSLETVDLEFSTPCHTRRHIPPEGRSVSRTKC